MTNSDGFIYTEMEQEEGIRAPHTGCFVMTDSRLVGDMRDVQRELNSCRSTVEKLLRTDPDFPAPITIGNKRQWFIDEIATYKANRPRRRYTSNAAA